jgi:HEAT repeat protein
LEDLLEHHLLQFAANPQQIEFHHQLFQEYYAAEWLLTQFPDLLKDETGKARLKQEYLNYLKWTEVIAVMLALVEDEEQAISGVKLGLELDLFLGARFAGSVKPAYQTQSIVWLTCEETPIRLQTDLLAISKSDAAIPGLLKALEDSESGVRWSTVEALGNLGNEAAIPGLLKALEDSDSDVRSSAVKALGNLGNEAVIPGLLKALEDSYSDVRRSAVEALGNLGNEAAIPGLLKALEDSEFYVRSSAAEALGNLGNEAAIPGLLKALEHSYSDVRRSAVKALGNLGNEAAIPGLLKALEDSEFYVRSSAVEALGNPGNEAAIPGLLKHSNIQTLISAVVQQRH